MVTTARQHYTIADVALLPHEEGTRYELIGGELLVSRQPHWHHQDTCGKIYLALQNWSQQFGTGLALQAPGIVYTDDEAVVPDVVWVRKERLSLVLAADGKLHVSPDLVVEVLSAGRDNEERDTETKLRLYSRRGVQEYWIADWRQRQVFVYRRSNGGLHLVGTLAKEDVLVSPLLPGFSCSIDRFFEV